MRRAPFYGEDHEVVPERKLRDLEVQGPEGNAKFSEQNAGPARR